MVLRKSFYIRWSAGRSPRVHEVNPGRDPSVLFTRPILLKNKKMFDDQHIDCRKGTCRLKMV